MGGGEFAMRDGRSGSPIPHLKGLILELQELAEDT